MSDLQILTDKFSSLKEAVVRCKSLKEDSPIELKELFYAATAASFVKTIQELVAFGPRLKSVSDAVAPLSDAHFADHFHAYGEKH